MKRGEAFLGGWVWDERDPLKGGGERYNWGRITRF